MNGAEERPLVFDCGGAELVGVVHRPVSPLPLGVLTVVAGGPQYRAGMGRGLVSMARALCEQGIAVMRFDHRGLGDSSGEFLGFAHLQQDLEAAIREFRREVPELEGVVLWGGCDAASGIMIHAHALPEVASVMLGNPFVSSEQTREAVTRRHYMKRLGEWSFWRKLLRFEYDIGSYAGSAFSKLRSRLAPGQGGRGKGGGAGGGAAGGGSPIDRMLAGLEGFSGPVLFVMSGKSLVSQEFDALLAQSPRWRKAYDRKGNRRVDLPDADQAFSSQDAKARVNAAVAEWVAGL